MEINELIRNIGPLDYDVMQKAVDRLNNLTKPVGSLGVLEDIVIQLAGITGEVMPKVKKKMVVVMAGDHGVVEEGVSSAPQSVTSQMVYNFLHGGAGSRCNRWIHFRCSGFNCL